MNPTNDTPNLKFGVFLISSNELVGVFDSLQDIDHWCANHVTDKGDLRRFEGTILQLHDKHKDYQNKWPAGPVCSLFANIGSVPVNDVMNKWLGAYGIFKKT